MPPKKRTRSGEAIFNPDALLSQMPNSPEIITNERFRTASMEELSGYLNNRNLNTNYSNSQPGLQIMQERDVPAPAASPSSSGESKKNKKKLLDYYSRPNHR